MMIGDYSVGDVIYFIVKLAGLHWFSLIVGLKILCDKGLTENTKLKEFFPS